MSAKIADELGPARIALLARRKDFVSVGVFSAAVNLLTLTGSFYMLEVYDRVLVSHKVETLIVLSLVALAAFALQGGLDMLRARMLSRIGAKIDVQLSPSAIRAATLLPLRGAGPGEALQPSRDVEQFRTFLSGAGPTAFFDLPFLPIFLIGCFLLHPWLGILAVVGGAIVIALTLIAERLVGPRAKEANQAAIARQILIDAGRRHAEVIASMGMGPAVAKRWETLAEDARAGLLKVSDAQGDLGSIARIFRVILQSAILGLGAYLSISGEVSGGAMIAASIMSSRALAPVEQAIAHWRGFVAARQAYQRLNALPSLVNERSVDLPAPHSLSVVRTFGSTWVAD